VELQIWGAYSENRAAILPEAGAHVLCGGHDQQKL
jgi:Na+-driven multidrug efflux pump